MKSSTAGELADRLIDTVSTAMGELVEHHAPGLELPGVFAGHLVDDNTTGDLVYVLGLLAACGVEEVAGVNGPDRALAAIRAVDEGVVSGFSSYRVGETLLRLGGRERLATWSEAERDRVLTAVRSDGVLRAARAGELPANWYIVAARCAATAAALGDESVDVTDLVDAVAAVFASSANGWMNDMAAPMRHFDIYTPDMYLFAEPFIDDLGDTWTNGLTSVLADLDDLAQPGGAVVWGRSIGALGLAITIELASIATGRGLLEDPGPWLRRAGETLDELQTWFDNGVISAHQHRTTMFYRGPGRRLQMTLDIYGKLLLAALELRKQPDAVVGQPSSAWPPTDRLIHFDDVAGAWAVRTRSLSFVLPSVLGFATDYLPSPRSPGLFETPTSGHPCFLPAIHLMDKTLPPAGVGTATHEPGRLVLETTNWGPVGSDGTGDDVVAGTRRATYTVSGRSLVIDEELTFASPAEVGPVAIYVPALASRPLDVDSDLGRVQTIDTSGIAEWRSYWHELDTVHQIEIEPTDTMTFQWTVTPRLKVASSIKSHPYDELLYAPILDRLIEVPAAPPDEHLSARLRDIDILHMAWPEWWTGEDPIRTREVLEEVKGTGVRIVWTQHNLLPHYFKTDDAAASYQLWAEAADAVIHHTSYGMQVALDTYDYGSTTRHVVIPHGHWGARYEHHRDALFGTTDRTELEDQLGWPSAEIRVAVVGSARVEKNVQLVVDAFIAADRDDMHLVIRTDGRATVPDHPRITLDRGHVDEGTYHRRMSAIDAVIMPFEPAGMLTTGTAFDTIGAGVAAITSDWAFFDEVFDGEDIRYGTTAADLEACLRTLTREQVDRGAQAMRDLQPRFDWVPIAEKTLELFEDLTR